MLDGNLLFVAEIKAGIAICGRRRSMKKGKGGEGLIKKHFFYGAKVITVFIIHS
jgi:hypothetical protein